MKVTGLETILLDNVRPYRGGIKWLFIKLTTDEGIVGLGERVTGGVTNLTSQIALLNDLCEQYVIGQNPFNVELIWHRAFDGAAMYDPKGAVVAGLSGMTWPVGTSWARRSGSRSAS